VTDQDKALEFYTQKLGFEKRSDQPMGPDQRWIEVAPKGAQTRILLYKATPDVLGAVSYEAAKASIGKPTGMVLEVDNIVATFAQLKENVVPIEEEPQKQPWGWWGVFADQDGNTYFQYPQADRERTLLLPPPVEKVYTPKPKWSRENALWSAPVDKEEGLKSL
jgi:lactoylglutathione lyase